MAAIEYLCKQYCVRFPNAACEALNGDAASFKSLAELARGDEGGTMATTSEGRALAKARHKAETAEQQARRMRDRQQRWHDEDMYLSRAEFEGGEPCRGCGELLLDGLLPGGWPPLLKMTPEQQADYDCEGAKWQERHGNCHAGRWSMQGSRTQHCSYCCPPPPMSQKQAEALRDILRPARERNLTDLVVWELVLTCGHTARATAHRDHGSYSPWTTRECEQCGGEIFGVISALQIGRADEVERSEKAARQEQQVPRGPKPPSKTALRRRLREAEQQAEALRLQLAALEELPRGR